MQFVLDNVFDNELGADGRMLMSLARAAHRYGQVIVVTQSERVATEIANLNGERTRLAPQQETVNKYRWNETQAFQLLVFLNATEKVKVSNKPSKTMWWRWWRAILRAKKKTTNVEGLQQAVRKTAAEFREDDVLISKTLESSSKPGGGWTPVGIIEFLLSGKKPVSAASAIAGRGMEGGLHVNVLLL